VGVPTVGGLDYGHGHVLDCVADMVVVDPDLNTVTGAWGLMLRSMLDLQPYFAARCAELDLTPTQGHVLLRMGDRAMIMRQIADALECDASTISGVVERLESRALVERSRLLGDRRAWMLDLSAEGKRVRARLIERLREPPRQFTRMAAADEQRLFEALSRLHEAPCHTFPADDRRNM
jgi:DNA-binding MarR family transcriptional regulator